VHAVQARCTVDGTPPSVYYRGALYSNTSTILRPSVLARCARCIIYNSFLLRTSHCPVDSHHDCIFSFLEVGAAFFTCFRGAACVPKEFSTVDFGLFRIRTLQEPWYTAPCVLCRYTYTRATTNCVLVLAHYHRSERKHSALEAVAITFLLVCINPIQPVKKTSWRRLMSLRIV